MHRACGMVVLLFMAGCSGSPVPEAVPHPAVGWVEVVVQDDELMPLGDAVVNAASGESNRTDAAGRVRLELEANRTHRITASATGYIMNETDVFVPVGATVTVGLVLRPIPGDLFVHTFGDAKGSCRGSRALAPVAGTCVLPSAASPGLGGQGLHEIGFAIRWNETHGPWAFEWALVARGAEVPFADGLLRRPVEGPSPLHVSAGPSDFSWPQVRESAELRVHPVGPVDEQVPAHDVHFVVEGYHVRRAHPDGMWWTGPAMSPVARLNGSLTFATPVREAGGPIAFAEPAGVAFTEARLSMVWESPNVAEVDPQVRFADPAGRDVIVRFPKVIGVPPICLPGETPTGPVVTQFLWTAPGEWSIEPLGTCSCRVDVEVVHYRIAQTPTILA